MQASFAFAGAIILTAMMASLNGAYAQAGQPAVPKAGVITPAAPIVPPYLRDPWKSYERNPYLAGTASKSRIFRRFRAVRRALHSGRAADACRDIGLGLRHSPVGEVHLIYAIWRSTW